MAGRFYVNIVFYALFRRNSVPPFGFHHNSTINYVCQGKNENFRHFFQNYTFFVFFVQFVLLLGVFFGREWGKGRVGYAPRAPLGRYDSGGVRVEIPLPPLRRSLFPYNRGRLKGGGLGILPPQAVPLPLHGGQGWGIRSTRFAWSV